MNDCIPNWYKKYGETIQNWMEGKSDYRVLWKDNAGNEYRYATFATDSHDAILRCVMAHPMILAEIVDAHKFTVCDLMTIEEYTAKVEFFMVNKHHFREGASKNYPLSIRDEYFDGRTPEDAADQILYEIEYGDEGT